MSAERPISMHIWLSAKCGVNLFAQVLLSALLALQCGRRISSGEFYFSVVFRRKSNMRVDRKLEMSEKEVK
jgi:hypothetical protein